MPSRFPGMDPYLETPAFWQDFHARFITYCCDMLTDQLPDSYEARIDERINLVGRPGDEARLIRPDVAVLQGPRSSASSATATAVAEIAEPVTIPLLMVEEVRETRVNILQRSDRTLVTVLELLSPSNKYEPGFGDYLSKRTGLLHRHVHLVELDLLLAGHRIPLRCPLPPGDYYALVARADRRPNCEVYAWTVRHPWPTIPVPLKAPDPDIRLNLGAVFSIAYERGRYARAIDYTAPPTAPLGRDDLGWAVERAKAITS